MPEKPRTVKARTFKKSRCKTEKRKNERTRRRLMIIASHISERVSSRPPGEWKGRNSGKLLFRGHMAARSRTNGSSNSLPGGTTFSGGSCLFAPPAEVAPPQITKQWFSYRQKNHKSNHFQQLPDMTRRDGHQGLVQWSLLPLLVCALTTVDNQTSSGGEKQWFIVAFPLEWTIQHRQMCPFFPHKHTHFLVVVVMLMLWTHHHHHHPGRMLTSLPAMWNLSRTVVFSLEEFFTIAGNTAFGVLLVCAHSAAMIPRRHSVIETMPFASSAHISHRA